MATSLRSLTSARGLSAITSRRLSTLWNHRSTVSGTSIVHRRLSAQHHGPRDFCISLPPSKKVEEKIASSQILAKRLNSTTTGLARVTSYSVGVAIFKGIARDAEYARVYPLQLLVLKRTETDAAFPDLWCVPGGQVEAGETVHEAISREVMEETGLVTHYVVKQFKPLCWETDGIFKIQMNFVASIKPPTGIRLNLAEHSACQWVTVEDVARLPCSEGMAELFANAFQAARDREPRYYPA